MFLKVIALCVVFGLMPVAAAAENTGLINNSIDEEKLKSLISKDTITNQSLNELSAEQITILQNWLKEKNINASTDSGNLTITSTSENIAQLQKWLNEHNFYIGEIDGEMGNYTIEAVKLFQKAAQITEDGEIGIQTLQTMKKWENNAQEITAKNTTGNSSQTLTSTGSDRSVKSSSRPSKKVTSKSNRSVRSSPRTYTSTRAYSRVSFNRGRGIGDCWDNSEHLYSQLTGSGTKARIIQYGTSLSPRHRSVQVYQNGAWVDYNYKANGYAKRYYATKSKPGVTVIK
ncbi:MAG: peptidoglycan-binding domain-containing protein [Methanobacterium sp.]